MSFFVKVINPNFVQGSLHVLRGGKPHRLAHPKSLDRDWFVTGKQASAAKKKAEQMFSITNPSTQFRVEKG